MNNSVFWDKMIFSIVIKKKKKLKNLFNKNCILKMIYFAVECISGIIKSSTRLSISATLERWYFNFCICNNWKNWLQFFIIMMNFKWINNRLADSTSSALYACFLMKRTEKFILILSGFRIFRSFLRIVLDHLSLYIFAVLF